jgi:flagellar motor protein MotB
MRAVTLSLLVALLAGCGTGRLKRQLAEQEREVADLRALTDRLSREVTQSRAEAARARGSLAKLRAQGVEVEIPGSGAETAEESPALDAVRTALTAALQGTGVTVLVRGDRVVISAPVAFDSGRATLTDSGRELLARIGRALAERAADYDVGVAGHTDSSRVVRAPNFSTNWELSGLRALAAMQALVETSGLPASRFHFRGYGEHRPVADNKAPEGRAANRRIEIILEPVH